MTHDINMLLKSYSGECNDDCNVACLQVYDPVCGSNSITYGNECSLNAAACLDDTLSLVSLLLLIRIHSYCSSRTVESVQMR